MARGRSWTRHHPTSPALLTTIDTTTPHLHHTAPQHISMQQTPPLHTTTPHYTTPHHTKPHHTTSHHTPSNHTTPHHTTPHHTTPHHTTPNHTTSHHTTPNHTTSHHTTPNHTTSHHTTPNHTNPQQQLTCVMTVSMTFTWSCMSFTINTMPSSSGRTRVGPNTMARLCPSIFRQWLWCFGLQ